MKTFLKTKIPTTLIYEVKDGKPIYYKDYEKVVKGEKSIEEVMGSSFIQSLIISVIVEYLFEKIDKTKYTVLFNEVGFSFGKSKRCLDIAIYLNKDLKASSLKNIYLKIPPKVVIEVDTKADLKRYSASFDFYVREKTQDLLDAGVEKVLWFSSYDRKVLIAERSKDWVIKPWNKDIDILDSISINLEILLKNKKEVID